MLRVYRKKSDNDVTIVLISTALYFSASQFTESKVLYRRCNTENNTDSTVTDIHKNSENSISITISYWSLGYAKGFEEAIMNYNRENKEGIRATVLKIPKDRYSETVNMLIASGEGPDVIGLNDELLNSYIDRRWILDLSGYIGDSFMSKFSEWAVNSVTDYAYRGNIYTFPSSMITFRLIYNRDLFEAAGLNPDNPPKTISQLIEYAGKISSAHKGERKYGFAIPGGGEWSRMKAYSSILDCYSCLQDKLTEENERLKIYYRMERSLGRYLEDEYIIKNFNPKEPLGEEL